MDKAKVYFTDFRTTQDVSLTVKLQKLCRRAGIGEIPFEGKFTAIKMHFGELGNLAYLRPNYAKAVADLVKEMGGKPFLTDCNTLYPGSRKNALDHLYNAEVNGFNSMTTGCYVIIADGLKGTDDIAVPVPNRISAWAAAAGPARCSSTTTGNRRWTPTCAGTAGNARGNADPTQSTMRRARP